jgi:RNA-directed DNA polymerase
MSAARSFQKIFSKKNLRKIFVERIRETTARGIDRTHPSALTKNLTQEVALIEGKVRQKSYNFTPYKERLISKGANDLPRVISIPTVRDRIALRGICDLLTEVFPGSVPEIPQIKIEALKSELEKRRFEEYVKIDLRHFYPSIPHDRLIQALRSRIRKDGILALIRDALSTPTVPEAKGGKGAQKNAIGVPQGLSISNLLAEIYLSKFDAEMKALGDILYSRYVDDILILCKSGTSEAIADHVCKALEQRGLKPHRLGQPDSKSKCGSLDEEFDFLGYHIHDGRLSIRKHSVHKLEGALARICTAYRHKLSQARRPDEVTRATQICEWRINLRLTGCIFGGKRLGWMFYFSQVNDTSCIRAVDNTVGKLMERFSLAGVIRPKRLLKAYYECQRKDKADHKYIPNFDGMDVDEQRRILSLLLGESRIGGLKDKRIEELFRMNISKAVKELEEDLANVS